MYNQQAQTVYHNQAYKQDDKSNESPRSEKKAIDKTESDKYDDYKLKQMITKLSKNDIEQLVGRISKHMSNDSLARANIENYSDDTDIHQSTSVLPIAREMQINIEHNLEAIPIPKQPQTTSTGISHSQTYASVGSQINDKSVIKHLNKKVK